MSGNDEATDKLACMERAVCSVVDALKGMQQRTEEAEGTLADAQDALSKAEGDGASALVQLNETLAKAYRHLHKSNAAFTRLMDDLNTKADECATLIAGTQITNIITNIMEANKQAQTSIVALQEQIDARVHREGVFG